MNAPVGRLLYGFVFVGLEHCVAEHGLSFLAPRLPAGDGGDGGLLR